MMYVLEYMVYHLKAYGYDTIVNVQCDKDESKGDHSSEINGTAVTEGENPEDPTSDRKRSIIIEPKNLSDKENGNNSSVSSKNSTVMLEAGHVTLTGNKTKTSDVKKIQSEDNLLKDTENLKSSLLKKTLSGGST